MIQAKCIQKFRDNKGKIYGYRLIDIDGKTQDVKPENLKQAIRNKKIHIVNLTLTSDNRLVDSSEKQLQSSTLGSAPIIRQMTTDKSKKEIENIENIFKHVFNILEKEINVSMGSYEAVTDEYFIASSPMIKDIEYGSLGYMVSTETQSALDANYYSDEIVDYISDYGEVVQVSIATDNGMSINIALAERAQEFPGFEVQSKSIDNLDKLVQDFVTKYKEFNRIDEKYQDFYTNKMQYIKNKLSSRLPGKEVYEVKGGFKVETNVNYATVYILADDYKFKGFQVYRDNRTSNKQHFDNIDQAINVLVDIILKI